MQLLDLVLKPEIVQGAPKHLNWWHGRPLDICFIRHHIVQSNICNNKAVNLSLNYWLFQEIWCEILKRKMFYYILILYGPFTLLRARVESSKKGGFSLGEGASHTCLLALIHFIHKILSTWELELCMGLAMLRWCLDGSHVVILTTFWFTS